MPPTLTDEEFRAHRWLPLTDAVTDRSGPELQAIIRAGNFPPTGLFRGMEYVKQHDHAQWLHQGYGRKLNDMGASVDPKTENLVPRGSHQ